METDTDRIDDAVLALLYLNLERAGRAWKGFDWDAMNRLFEKGFISDPVSKAKSVWLTDEGIARGETLLRELFGRSVSEPDTLDRLRGPVNPAPTGPANSARNTRRPEPR